MTTDGIAARNGDMAVRDIAEILADALPPEPAETSSLNQPMEFDLTPEQLSLQKAAIDFARAELSSDMIERDAERVFSHDGWKKCAAFGVHGLPVPEEFGGSGSDPVTTIAVMEGLGYGSPDQGLLFSINAHMWTNSIPLLKYGTREQKQKYLPGLCDGSLIGANGASEPNAGSDVFSMRTRVTKNGGDYILNGTKTFVTNAPVADLFAVYGTLDPKLGGMGICGFIIEKGTPGLSVGKKMDKMGLRTAPMAELVLENCRVRPRLCWDAKDVAPKFSVARWLGNGPASWRLAWEPCAASLNAALTTPARGSNSANRSASSSRSPTASSI